MQNYSMHRIMWAPVVFLLIASGCTTAPESSSVKTKEEKSKDTYQWSYRLKTKEKLAPGVKWQKRVYLNLFDSRQSVNILFVDLARAKLKPWDAQECQKIPQVHRNDPSIAAINGTYYGATCSSRNMLKIDGELISRNIMRQKPIPALLIAEDSTLSLEMKGPTDEAKAAQHAIGGFPRLVKDKKLAIKPKEETGFFQNRHPRTAVGVLSKKKLALVTVDGRTEAGAGMTILELARLMKKLGAQSAMNMDGGGSTIMWIQNKGVVNYPPGNEKADAQGVRPVSDGLAVYPKNYPKKD